VPTLFLRDIPHELLDSSSLTVPARFIYVSLWGSPGRSMRGLSAVTGYHHHAVKVHCDLLQKAGWADMQRKRTGYVVFATIPREVQERLATEFLAFLDTCAYVGESVTRAWRDVLVADHGFVDNFRPDFLRNPRTGQAMEYDMYEPQRRLAIEYNGPQHYGPTLMFPDPREYQEQRTRDLVKQGLSAEHGIRLITIEARDLTLKGMLAKLDGLPLKRYDPSGPCIKMLEEVGSKLIRAAEKLDKEHAAAAATTQRQNRP